MIQRIQTVYLLLVALLTASMFFTPFVTFISETEVSQYILTIKGLALTGEKSSVLFRVWPIVAILIVSLIITLVTIFLYKRRLLQIRLSIVSIFLMAGIIGLTYYYSNSISLQMKVESTYGFSFVFPLIAIILDYLAIRSITKDEKLIRSLDRLR